MRNGKVRNKKCKREARMDGKESRSDEERKREERDKALEGKREENTVYYPLHFIFTVLFILSLIIKVW